ncbi:hypothetical protein Jiend_57820 [Micromonospora endophytica]|uniref:carbohydrate kinase family protein n=1 Tax=Micromonospora endophytica TaxID=515350 RepID=UPI001C341309|nr:hypothetical protein Jiend_57820 [Micromonospora endophytica]
MVKASEEDVAWLYPDRSIAQVLRHWQDLGVALAVVTLGAGGVVAASGTREFRLPAPVVDVVDTIGAGDSFTAGLLAGLSRAPPAGPTRRSPPRCGTPWRSPPSPAPGPARTRRTGTTCRRPGG